jgi:hypothetical protein
MMHDGLSIEQSHSGSPDDMAMSGMLDVHESEQVPLQQVCVPVQVLVPHRHLPPTQVEPLPHEWPHMPQLRMSLSRLAQPAFGQHV